MRQWEYLCIEVVDSVTNGTYTGKVSLPETIHLEGGGYPMFSLVGVLGHDGWEMCGVLKRNERIDEVYFKRERGQR